MVNQLMGHRFGQPASARGGATRGGCEGMGLILVGNCSKLAHVRLMSVVLTYGKNINRNTEKQYELMTHQVAAYS